MIRRRRPTATDLWHIARKSSFCFAHLRLCVCVCVCIPYRNLTWRGLSRSSGAKERRIESSSSLMIKFDRTPTWHLPCRRSVRFILFAVFILVCTQSLLLGEVFCQEKKKYFWNKVIRRPYCRCRRVTEFCDHVRMRRAVRR